MKGISSVIAVVLILMITVALSAMAYVWFTGVFEDISGSAGDAASSAASQIGSGFSIVSAYHTVEGDFANVQLTNTGTSTLLKENFNILIVSSGTTTGIPAEITSTETGELKTGETVTREITNATTSTGYRGEWCGKQVTVKYGDLEQTTTMAC